ncbi:MAG: hypothetical protein R3302_02795 [Sulfurimonadaceae bacterium]|nr:hypothetical protein [Sulfurimonadaceae bacterium]
MIKAIKQIVVLQALLLALWPISFELFINIEIAFFSSFFILLGSMYSYAKLVSKRVESYEGRDEKDLVEKIDDPYDLYDDEEQPKTEVDPDEVDLKELIKEEKKRIKATGAAKNVKKTAPAMVSLYRLVPYGFLVLGFIGLKNNGLLELWPYLIGIGLGVLAGLFVGKELFKSTSVENSRAL